ncbi:MAG: DUF421 domain-containing protein [Mycobacterium leprae]
MAVELGITWARAASVVITAVVIYLALVIYVRAVGQRSLASMSSFDFGVAVALGAVIGHTVLLLQPTLLTGLVAMTVLFATQAAFGALRTHRRVDRLLNRPPVLLMAGRTPLMENMRRSHVTEDELRQRIRLAGLASLDHVLAVVLERNGQVSVLRHGPVSLELF